MAYRDLSYICSLHRFGDKNNLCIENNVIAIRTCCGFNLVRLVENRLQPWKKIAYKRQNFEYFQEFSWLLSAERIIGTRYESQQTEENKRKLFIIDTQTEAIKYQDLALEHENVRFLAFFYFC